MCKFLFLIGFTILLLLPSCASKVIVNARQEMETSKAKYKECLEQNPQDVSKCEALQKAFEADLEAFKAMKIYEYDYCYGGYWYGYWYGF